MKKFLVLTSLIFLISCGSTKQDHNTNIKNSNSEKVYIYDQETNKKLKQAEDFINDDRYDKAFPILFELAKQGNPTAQNDVGASYQYGFNGETDEEKAIHWYTLAAKQNHAPSIHNLGLIAFNNAKNDQDYQKALTLFEKAAKLGSYEAINYIGIYYKNGIIFPQDSTKALEKFLFSADHGSAA
ncbi:tetratricopeptide repeat protein, partial [Acinetobacter gyllenbergii]|uniref:tetratricopeptide repeat protein n=1 Tax=Acinetobacter gyllenbergii TaxID=134534 RepID=UPI0003BF4AF2